MIQRLPGDVSKRIKAQQSVQSVYVVVKDLVENAIDAGCTWVRIRVDDSITVEDNGCGIDDLDKVGVEGSTSKDAMSYYVLGCVDMVEQQSYGFRGQALSAIAEMCDLEIVSRSTQPHALRKDFSTNTTTRCARERGTTVSVRNLFKNCPVRKSASEACLKKDLGRICSLIESYRCVNKVNFTLFHKRKVLLSCGGYTSPREYFASNYSAFAGKYMEVSNGMLEFLMLPVAVKDPRQLMFLEKRPICNKRILGAVRGEFNLYAEGNPTFVLVLKGHGDVNVSVDKSEVILADEPSILSLLKSEIGRFFSSEVLLESPSAGGREAGLGSRGGDGGRDGQKEAAPVVGSFSAPSSPGLSFLRPRQSSGTYPGERAGRIATRPFEDTGNSSQASAPELPTESPRPSAEDTESLQNDVEAGCEPPLSHSSPRSEPGQEKENIVVSKDIGAAAEPHTFFRHDEAVQPKLSFSKEDFTRLRIIGQFNSGFIITKLEKDGKTYLVAVDQHAADEISNFEAIRKTFCLKKQRVIVPVSLGLTPIEEMVVGDNLELFEKYGFSVRDGMLETVPVYRNRVFGIKEFRELLEDVRNGEEFGRVRSIIASKACRTSVMIGDVLSAADMERIVRGLAFLDRPWKCPHGRPTFMVVNESVE